eukprot:2661015-Rhodomonas_salina.1
MEEASSKISKARIRRESRSQGGGSEEDGEVDASHLCGEGKKGVLQQLPRETSLFQFPSVERLQSYEGVTTPLKHNCMHTFVRLEPFNRKRNPSKLLSSVFVGPKTLGST